MKSLLDIKAKVEAAQQGPMPKGQPAPQVRGDELLAQAQKLTSLDSDEQRFVRLFSQSKQLLEAKIEEDDAWGTGLMARMQGLSGDKLAQAVIDEADDLKIEHLKETNPKLFSGGGAATAGFLNEATFGQLSRVMGKAGELINGQPYEELVEAKAEEFRLLQKAFPKSDFVGRAASYLLPGSPAKALFTKAATLGGKTAAGLLQRFAQNPSLLQKAAQSAASVGAGAAAVAGTAGTLGTGNEELSFDRGLENAVSAGATSALIGFGAPLVARGASEVAKAAAPTIRSASKAIEARVGNSIGQLTGTDPKALRAFNENAGKLRRAAGTEDTIGNDLVDFLQSSKSQLPEVAKANELLPSLPNVDAAPVLKYLRTVKTGLDPSLDPKVNILAEWANRIENTVGNGQVPAAKMREVVDLMQDSVREQFGKESPFLAGHLKQAARLARESIVGRAQQDVSSILKPGLKPDQFDRAMKLLAAGAESQLAPLMKSGVSEIEVSAAKNAASYVTLMEKAADKRSVLKFIGKQLGSTPELQEKNAERFVSGLFGQNKEMIRARMADLDRQFGTNFLEQAENSFLAKQLGAGGVPSTFSNLRNGGALLGGGVGGSIGAGVGAAVGGPLGAAVGGPIGSGIGAVASSPRAGAAILGASDKITGFVRRMVANPEALSRLKSSGATPIQIRKIAQEIENALIKDGPISAGGVTRIVADTPYFIGLVHAFEKAERESKGRKQASALQKLDNQRNQGIAVQPQ